MTMMSPAAAQAATHNPFGGLARWIAARVNALAAHWVCREAIKALQRLDDRELRDIGLARCQIEAAVSGIGDPELGRLR